MMSEETKQAPVSSVGSYAIVALCILVSDSTRGILFPTLFLNVSSMGGNALHLGWAVAALSAGKILSTPILGYISDVYGYRNALVLSNSVLGAGCVVYILAQSVTWLVFAQFVVGLGAGRYHNMNMRLISCYLLITVLVSLEALGSTGPTLPS